jgi:hypothetical protein
LVDLYKVTGDTRYSNAAISAGNYIYNNDYLLFRYVGGTPDNPNVPDKEAASLALRAFLALYDLNKENRWLDAATQTAYYYQTWVYSWHVPIPADDAAATYPKNRSTSGLSLIATSNSAADSYASVDAFSFYRLYLYRGDQQFRETANLLLYNTKQGLNWDRSNPIPGFGRWGMIEEAQTVSLLRGHGVGVYLPWQTFNMMEPMVLFWDAFGANSYDIATIDGLANKNTSHLNYSNTRGFVKSTGLRSAMADSTNNVEKQHESSVFVYSNENKLYIHINDENYIGGKVVVYDTNGIIVLQEALKSSGKNTFVIERKGVYVVKVTGKTQNLTEVKKVVIW